MKKTEINTLLREYVKNHLSPTKDEQTFVSNLYDSFKVALGNNCVLIGSYARFTASRPLHDLDILFIAGKFDQNNLHPQTILTNLKNTIHKEFKNPTNFQTKISQQTHSITIGFVENNIEKFSVDIVPAFISGLKNEFEDDIYWVPEILKVSPHNRQKRYQEFQQSKKSELEWWLKSDPRGYIKATTDLNNRNNDFRKVAKFIKRWKHNCKTKNDDFKLKSFHIEQSIYKIFKSNPNQDIFSAIFEFFCKIPEMIARPQIEDRADSSKFIDDYIANLTNIQKKVIIEARDFFLIKLENFDNDPRVSVLLESGFRIRRDPAEEYLFDSNIPILLDKSLSLKVTGNVLPRNGSFGAMILDAIGFINVDRKIKFSNTLKGDIVVDLFKWKVKNDDDSQQPRGEITDHSTFNEVEHTRYNGKHFVECYGIKNGVCIAKDRQDVVLKFFGRIE